MSLSEYIVPFVLVAIMGAGLPGPGDASLIAARSWSASEEQAHGRWSVCF